MHAHVRRDRGHCKFWLAPVALAWNHGFNPRELNETRHMVVEYQDIIIEAMSTAVSVESRIGRVDVTDELTTAYLQPTIPVRVKASLTRGSRLSADR